MVIAKARSRPARGPSDTTRMPCSRTRKKGSAPPSGEVIEWTTKSSWGRRRGGEQQLQAHRVDGGEPLPLGLEPNGEAVVQHVDAAARLLGVACAPSPRRVGADLEPPVPAEDVDVLRLRLRERVGQRAPLLPRTITDRVSGGGEQPPGRAGKGGVED